MVGLSLRWVLGLSALALLAGCTAFHKLTAPDLEGAPESTGLLVVDCDVEVIAAVFGIRTNATPVGGLLARLDGEGAIAEGGEADGLIVFSGLQPGRWQLLAIDTEWNGGNSILYKQLAVGPDDALKLAVDVRAGEPIYLRVEVEDDLRSDSRGVRFALEPDSESQREAWESLAAIYADSAWGPKLQSLP